MPFRKSTRFLYKHAELTSLPAHRFFPSTPGLSTLLRTPFVDYDDFKEYFRSDFLAVIIINRGQISGSINFEDYCMTQNDLMVMSPNTIKRLVDVQAGTLISGISFTADFLPKMGFPQQLHELIDYFSSQYSPVWHLEANDCEAILGMMERIEQYARNKDNHVYGMELLYHEFYIFVYEMAALSKKYARQLVPQFSRKENLLIQFTNLVQRQFRSQRSVQAYAAQLNITPKYLTETVKEMSGKTAGEIIDDYVLLEAKLYLNNPEYSIAQVASELNFSDQSFFGKFFKRYTGLSPKEYRSRPD